MDLGLAGKVVIVTGSGRGIGAATVRAFAEEGARVVVTDIDAQTTERTVAALCAEGFTATGIACDVTRADQVDRLLAHALEAHGTVHVLVNNAGFPRDGYITRMSEADWDAVVDVALKGAFLCSKAVMPTLLAQRWGRIVNISSRAHLGNPGQANYSAAKAGLIGLTRALAYEEGKFGITVNAVAPGFVETELVQQLPAYEQIKDRWIKATPTTRLGLPRDIADAVMFIASERAAFINGEVLHVTGGRYGN
jgi:3-oxoacyl-[acyl-carrier protein] reductase